MEETTRKIIGDISQYFEHNGLSRTSGMIAGLLMVSEKPCSLDDLAQQLGISKASASLNTRVLINIGLVEKTYLHGDRKTYFQFLDFTGLLQSSILRAKEFVAIIKRAQGSIAQDNEIARQRFAHMAKLYGLMVDELERIVTESE